MIYKLTFFQSEANKESKKGTTDMRNSIFISTLFSMTLFSVADAQSPIGTKEDTAAKFRQLDNMHPSPNMYRSASGAPGPMYWQQKPTRS